MERIGRIQKREPDAGVDVESLSHLSPVEMVVVACGDPCSAPSPDPGPTHQKVICASEDFRFAAGILRRRYGNLDLLARLWMKLFRHGQVAVGEDLRFVSKRRHRSSLRSKSDQCNGGPYRYFGFDQFVDLIERAAATPESEAATVEAELDRAYAAVIPTDSVLVSRFEVDFAKNPGAYGPVE